MEENVITHQLAIRRAGFGLNVHPALIISSWSMSYIAIYVIYDTLHFPLQQSFENRSIRRTVTPKYDYYALEGQSLCCKNIFPKQIFKRLSEEC